MQTKSASTKPKTSKKPSSTVNAAPGKGVSVSADSGDKQPGKNKVGRPTDYTPELAAQICALIAIGKSLRTIAAMPGMPSVPAIFRWLGDDRDTYAGFRNQYARAKEQQADMMAEDMLVIADDGSNDTYIDDDGNPRTDHDVIARSRLRVDTRKWLASKFAPKKFGEKVEATLKGDPENPLTVLHRQISGTGFKPRDADE